MATQQISLDLLGDIIKGLKLDDFAYVEPDALTIIKSMIKNLPERESLEQYALTPHNIENIQKDIGKIMRLIEIYGKRDLEYKTRYRAKTELDPRYKVLDNNTQKAANKVAKGLIRVSAILDNDDQISSELIRCAMKAYVGGLTELDMADTTANIFEKIGFNEQAKIVRNAITEYNVDMQEIRRELSQIFNSIKKAKTLTEEKYRDMSSVSKTNPLAERVINQLSSIWNDLLKVESASNAVVDRLDQTTNQVEKDMMNVVPRAAYWPGVGSLPIKYIDDPDPVNKGWMIATVEHNGKTYEVQEDNRGNQSFKPFNPAVSSGNAVSVKPTETPLEPPEVSKNVEQEYTAVKPMFEKLLNESAGITDLKAIQNFIQMYKNKKQDISKVPATFDFRKPKPAFNLSGHIIKLAQMAEDVKDVVKYILGRGISNTSRISDVDLVKLEQYVNRLLIEEESKTGVAKEKPIIEKKPMPEEEPIPDEVLSSPEQSKNLFYSKMEKKIPIDDAHDKIFMDQMSQLLSSISASSDTKAKNTLAMAFINLRNPSPLVDPEIEKTTKLLRDLKKNFYNKEMYDYFLNMLISSRASPSVKTKKFRPEEPIVDVERDKGEVVPDPPVAPSVAPEKKITPAEQPLPKSIVGKKIQDILYQMHKGQLKIEDFPNEIQKREEEVKILKEKIPTATKWYLKEYSKQINGKRAEIEALKQIKEKNLTFASKIFNLSNYIRYS